MIHKLVLEVTMYPLKNGPVMRIHIRNYKYKDNKRKIQKGFRNQVGLILDTPRQGSGISFYLTKENPHVDFLIIRSKQKHYSCWRVRLNNTHNT